MKTLLTIFCLATLSACQSSDSKKEEEKRDSIELEKVDKMRVNEDSLIEEEKKRLMEKYGN
jgi:hypothetical protein